MTARARWCLVPLLGAAKPVSCHASKVAAEQAQKKAAVPTKLERHPVAPKPPAGGRLGSGFT